MRVSRRCDICKREYETRRCDAENCVVELRKLVTDSPRRPEVGGPEAKNARAPWPRRDSKRLDSGRAR
jgi:hypothetical protein